MSQQNVNTAAKESEETSALKTRGQLSFFDMPAVSGTGDSTTSRSAKATAISCLSAEEARREFIRVFRQTAYCQNRWNVFRDFITLAASELDMARIRMPENIDNSRRICSQYQPDDLDNLKRLFCLLVEALEGQFHDFLGSVFMELELGSSEMGQFFTPYPLARLIAGLTVGDALQQLTTCPWVTLSEPTSGAGGMVIAFAEVMLARGLNPAEQLLVTATDIDPLAADMTFIQLSLLGIPAIVNTGNSLALTVNRTRYTPVYYFNNWEARIRLHERIQAMRDFLS